VIHQEHVFTPYVAVSVIEADCTQMTGYSLLW